MKDALCLQQSFVTVFCIVQNNLLLFVDIMGESETKRERAE